MMEYITPQLIMSIFLGVSLAACAGLRVFLPLAIASAALKLGWLPSNATFEWLSHDGIFIALVVATFVESMSYLVPWLDNSLDVIAAPVAVVAGTVLASAAYVDLPIEMQIGLGLITGGTAAGFVHGTTSLLRAGSTKLTGGLANPFFSKIETLFAGIGSFMAIFLPLIAFIGFIIFCFVAVKLIKVILIQRKAMKAAASQFSSQYNGYSEGEMKTVNPDQDF